MHGARAVVRVSVKKTDARSRWVNELRERHEANRATVAVANKDARIIRAVLRTGEPYRARSLKVAGGRVVNGLAVVESSRLEPELL